jgi:hypothetical protein
VPHLWRQQSDQTPVAAVAPHALRLMFAIESVSVIAISSKGVALTAAICRTSRHPHLRKVFTEALINYLLY